NGGAGVGGFPAPAGTPGGNDGEDNVGGGGFVLESAGVIIKGNIMGDKLGGIKNDSQLAKFGQPFYTTITNNSIDLNHSHGVYVIDSSNNVIGAAGALAADTPNIIGSDEFGIPNEPNGADGVMIAADFGGQSINNTITENLIGNNNGNGV